MEETGDSTVSIGNKVFLAPMVRGSELAFRQIIRRYGVKTCYSPMLRAEEVVKAFDVWRKVQNHKDTKTMTELESAFRAGVPLGISHEDGLLLMTDILPDPAPLVVQLCGNDPKVIGEATRRLLEFHYADDIPCCLEGIDLNLGCPQKCALEGHFGAFLAEKNPELAVACVAAMRQTIDEIHMEKQMHDVSVPRLSCKIRLLDTDVETIAFAKQLINVGCELLAVHCRRREGKSKGNPDLRGGRILVESLPGVTVIINGAIASTKDVCNTLSQTNAAGVMIATGFLSNPRLLVEPKTDPAILAAEYLESCEVYPPVSPLFIQKHLRWIFRPYLEPKDMSTATFKDWRPRLWTFLVRPYLETMDQFRQVVALFVKLNGSEMPPYLCDQPEPSFQTVRHHPSRSRNVCKKSASRLSGSVLDSPTKNLTL